MRDERRLSRWNSPSTWIALVAGGAVAGAIALAMAPAQAEAAKTTATLTLTGIVDSNCQVSVGGTTAYVRPGGTVTVKPSLAGASVTIDLGLLGKKTIPLDSSKVASFVDTVKIGGKTHVLKTADSKFVLKNVRKTQKITWSATSVSILGGIGTIPLNGSDVNLPAKGKLSWSGKIIASKNTDCGIQIQTPSVSVSAPGVSIGVPGQTVSAPNPVNSITKVLKSHLPTSSSPKTHASSKAGGHSKIKYTPPPTTVPQKVMSRAGQNPAGGGGGGYVAPKAGTGGGGGGAAPAHSSRSQHGSSTPNPSPAAKIKHDKKQRLADPASGLGGTQLPVLLAILAILALSMVTATYARMRLLHRNH